MKRITLLAVAILLGLSICIGQSSKSKNKDLPEMPKTEKGVTGKPQTNIQVNKEYDKQGNLIRYDSTYSWSYSGNGENAAVNDSMLNEFKSFFSQGSSLSLDGFFDGLMPQDSISGKDTDLDSFFGSQFSRHREQMRQLFSEMDSLQRKSPGRRMMPDTLQTTPKQVSPHLATPHKTVPHQAVPRLKN